MGDDEVVCRPDTKDGGRQAFGYEGEMSEPHSREQERQMPGSGLLHTLVFTSPRAILLRVSAACCCLVVDEQEAEKQNGYDK